MIRLSGYALGIALALMLALPLLALSLSAAPEDLLAGIKHPMFMPAAWLSLRTTLISLLLITVTGTPLAYWLATTRSRLARAVAVLIDLPIVIPPAVIGVALLQLFGRRGFLGSLDLGIPFTQVAVIIAQVVVAAPFFVQAAANAFRKVDLDLMLVARTLGASGPSAFFRVALPVALPGLIAGASLAWARALGEFGATLLFAGNMSGSTQTMPLAIYTALATDVRLAVAFAVVLGGFGLLLLLALRMAPIVWARR